MTLNISVNTGKMFTPTEKTSIKITSNDNRVWKTRFAQGDNPEWYDSFDISIEQKELHFQLIERVQQFGKPVLRVLATATITFNQNTYSHRVQIPMSISLMNLGKEVAQAKIVVFYNPALKLFGCEKKNNLDCSDVKLTVDPSRSRAVEYTVNERQGTRPFNSGTNTIVGETNRVLDNSSISINRNGQPIEQTIQQREITLGNHESGIQLKQSMESVDTSGILKIHANKRNIFSWMDDFSQKLSFQFAPKKIRRT